MGDRMTGLPHGAQWPRRNVLQAFGIGAVSIGLSGTLAGCAPRGGESTGGGASGGSGGGVFRVGIRGGSNQDTLDPHHIHGDIDTARTINLCDSLGVINADATMSHQLAESMEQNADGSEWTFRLKEGLTFHNGKDVTAEDLMATFMRLVDKKDPSPNAPQLEAADFANMKKLDARTVRVPMLRPNVVLGDTLSQFQAFAVVPADFDPKKPVGAGPYMYKSFTPGKESVFVPFPDYWGGAPKVDELHILDLADEQAQVNALLNGQVDAIAGLTAGSMSLLQGQKNVAVSIGEESGGWAALTMLTTKKPFDDPRIRKALQLCADREQMRKSVYNGHGTIGNDVPSIWDPMFDKNLAQRTQDLAASRALLKEAGYDRLSLELTVGDVFSGAIEQAVVFAEQAKEGGFDITVNKVDVPTLYADYGNWAFSVDWFYYNPYLQQVSMTYAKDAGFNTTQWRNAEFEALHAKAFRTFDDAEREQIIHEMNRIEHEQGPLVLSVFAPTIDGVRTNVKGLIHSRTGVSLGCYDFRNVTVA